MIRTVSLLALLAVLGACGDGQPLFNDDEPTGPLPPGTDTPAAGSDINRFEERNDLGGGFVEEVRFDRESDTFFVDNLAFDGDNVYTRDDDVRTLSDRGRTEYRVFEGDEIERDPVDGDEITQFEYKAIYGESRNRDEDGTPLTSFAIVRTGSYLDYGFGGFVYERNGGVDLPTEGQATYAGDYAGIRTFDGDADRTLEYVTGEVNIAVDFRDFNEGEGVRGQITDRQVFDLQGNNISDQLPLPPLVFDVGPGTLTDAGELSNGIRSQRDNPDGADEEYEAGTYYAIVAGENAGEIVGVIVVESDDPRYSSRDEDGEPRVTAQETGGFIVYR